MSNVIRPPQFDRPKIHQPHPRLRKGTINFRRRRVDILYARDRAQGRSVRYVQAQESVSKVVRNVLQEDARSAERLPVYLPAQGREAFAIYHALRVMGIDLDFDAARQAIVLRVVDDRRPVA